MEWSKSRTIFGVNYEMCEISIESAQRRDEKLGELESELMLNSPSLLFSLFATN